MLLKLKGNILFLTKLWFRWKTGVTIWRQTMILRDIYGWKWKQLMRLWTNVVSCWILAKELTLRPGIICLQKELTVLLINELFLVLVYILNNDIIFLFPILPCSKNIVRCLVLLKSKNVELLWLLLRRNMWWLNRIIRLFNRRR